MILPYYKIEQTEKGKQFFYAHRGYFNFWDEYLIMNIDEGNNQVFFVLVNRTGRKFSGAKPTDDCLKAATLHTTESIQLRKPEEMFVDFPELEKYDVLKEGTRVKVYGRKGVIDRVTEWHGKLAYIVYIDGQVDCEVLYPECLEVIDE